MLCMRQRLPQKARTFESPFAEIIHSSFTEQKENKTIL